MCQWTTRFISLIERFNERFNERLLNKSSVIIMMNSITIATNATIIIITFLAATDVLIRIIRMC